MDRNEFYKELFENQTLKKNDALIYVNYRIGKAIDKPKAIESLTNNIDRLKILLDDVRLELRLHQDNPAMVLDNSKFYTMQQAADILSISSAMLRELIHRGQLEVKAINQRVWRIHRWSLDAYINDITNYIMAIEEPIINYQVYDIYDVENLLIDSIISEHGIHTIHEYQTRIPRKINDTIGDL